MDEEFIRNRITELRLKKGISEYQLSLELGAKPWTTSKLFLRPGIAFHEAILKYLRIF